EASVQDLQPQEDLVFHAYSIKEMLDFMNTSAQAGPSCAVSPTATKTNTAPLVTVAAADYVIPAKTPFVLKAEAVDTDPEDAGRLTYSWEQLNIGAPNPTNEDDGARPLFRSYMPVASGIRYFPSPQYVL